MRYPIEIIRGRDNPVFLDGLTVKVSGPDFSSFFTDKDENVAQEVWASVKNQSPGAFSNPGGLATLYDATKGLLYHPTQFRDYMAVTHTSKSQSLTSKAYDTMRVAAVEASLFTGDGKILVHRRSENATHAAGLWDSSCAGLCHVVDGSINPEKSIYDKLKKELGVAPEEVSLYGLAGIHSSASPDFSGAFSILLTTSLDSKELDKRIRPGAFAEHEFVPINKLGDFIVQHYAVEKNMIGDGAATLLGLLGFLSERQFEDAVVRINCGEKEIVFGELREGVFSETNF